MSAALSERRRGSRSDARDPGSTHRRARRGRRSAGAAPDVEIDRRGDIVEIDKKGRRFHALVTEVVQGESGRFELDIRPLDSRISYRTATVREVVGLWRKARSV